MDKRHFISVIMPLKLEWEPCYYTNETIQTGDRVKVEFARKEYVAVVSGVDIKPDIDSCRIKPVVSVETSMEKISDLEINLWREVARYYMCSIGEVYKAAYPSGKVNLEEARAAAKQKVIERRVRVAEAIEIKLQKLNSRLEGKRIAADKAKEGTKAKQSHLADIDKINEEIRKATEAKEISLYNIEAAKEGLTIGKLPYPQDNISLSEHQQNAYDQIQNGFKERKPVLLHGITGSGKTEIYMKLTSECIQNGKNVLYLVPEIALSRQLEDRLSEQFGDRLLTFHSGESAASRRNSAEIIRNTKAESGGYIALCTRSGIFLPHNNLGLIIVDEEHDNSYKQDSPAPRYNGRDTALMLSRLHEGCNIILGSATPSLEELYNTNIGRHILVTLKEKYHGSGNAEIEIIDTKAERCKRGMVGNFSRKLIEHIKTTLNAGEQVLILRSRRAWSTTLQCDSCGEILKCPHCNVSMNHHKAEGKMTCHYCGYSTIYTGTCTKCGGSMKDLGAGTQRIEEEAVNLFPDAKIARLDSDTAQNKTYESRTIKDFAKGNIDILIGTQIITKGFDFERLGLVAVIAADTLLGIQDFRADEKAMHLLEQFRGRCGRREKTGLFVIQTSQPDHPIYQSISCNGHKGFTTRLLLERKDFDFPPYTRIIELSIKDIYEDRAERMAARLADSLNGFNMTGPYAPVIDKIADQHIRKIRISMKKDRRLSGNKEQIKKTIAAFEKKNRYDGHISIDVDPA